MDRDWRWHFGVRARLGGFATSGPSVRLPQPSAAPAASGTGPSDTAMPGRFTDSGGGLLPGTAIPRAATRGRTGLMASRSHSDMRSFFGLNNPIEEFNQILDCLSSRP